jgi:hypothetical protein
MDIVVISSAFVKNEQQKKRVTRVPARRPHFTEKRRNRVDRRKSVRDGVVVSLSCRKERRTGIDRRRADTD